MRGEHYICLVHTTATQNGMYKHVKLGFGVGGTRWKIVHAPNFKMCMYVVVWEGALV